MEGPALRLRGVFAAAWVHGDCGSGRGVEHRPCVPGRSPDDTRDVAPRDPPLMSAVRELGSQARTDTFAKYLQAAFE